MRKLFAVFTVFLTGLPLFVNTAWAANEKKDDDRLKNCGSVLYEIVNVPDNIPQDHAVWENCCPAGSSAIHFDTEFKKPKPPALVSIRCRGGQSTAALPRSESRR
jgi:hypothetical protein